MFASPHTVNGLPLMSEFRLQEWQWFVLMLFVTLVLMLVPELAFAQNKTTDSGAISQLKAERFMTSIRYGWKIISNFLLFGGLGFMVGGYFLGLGQKVSMLGGLLVVIAAFGQEGAEWVYSLGTGTDLIGKN